MKFIFFITLPDNFLNRSAETDSKRLAKPFYSKTPLLKTDADRFRCRNRSAETDSKRLAKPFYSKTPLLKTDANRFRGIYVIKKISVL